MNSRLKIILGILLILVSIGFMIFWEADGRKLVMNKEVAVTARDVSAGEVLAEEDLVIKSIPKDNIVSGAVDAGDISRCIGKRFKYDVGENSQVTVNSFISEENVMEEGVSLFMLKKDWILNISTSLRMGDHVFLYSYDNSEYSHYLGDFYVAFVKDSSGREVVELTGFDEPRVLKRYNGQSVPAEAEIAATLPEYAEILKAVQAGKKLILVQKEVNSYE